MMVCIEDLLATCASSHYGGYSKTFIYCNRIVGTQTVPVFHSMMFVYIDLNQHPVGYRRGISCMCLHLSLGFVD